MWHFLITDLVPPADDGAEHLRPRLPGLEARLARGRRTLATPTWRHELAALAGAAVPAGPEWPTACDLAAAAGRLHAASAWAVVSPVRLAAGLDHVQLEQVLPAPSRSLVEAFNRDFGAAEGLLVPCGGSLLWALPQPLAVIGYDPQGLRGHDVGPRLPAGRDAARVRRWMTEAQMWLHAHDSPEGANGLWPWGFGHAAAAGCRPTLPWPVQGADDWVHALPSAAAAASTSRVTLWRLADHVGAAGAFAAADVAWSAALDAALHTVGRATVWLAGTRHELTALDRWRFWRRWHTPRAWWQ